MQTAAWRAKAPRWETEAERTVLRKCNNINKVEDREIARVMMERYVGHPADINIILSDIQQR